MCPARDHLRLTRQLTIHGSKILLMGPSEDLFVEDLCFLVLALLQVARGLRDRERERERERGGGTERERLKPECHPLKPQYYDNYVVYV